MRLTVEEEFESTKAIIVAPHHNRIATVLKERLDSYSISTLSHSSLPKNFSGAALVFILDTKITVEQLLEWSETPSKFIFTFAGHPKQFAALAEKMRRIGKKNILLIQIPINPNTSKIVDDILWFSLSKSHETVLDLSGPFPDTAEVEKKRAPVQVNRRISMDRKKIFGASFFVLMCVELFFILPLILSGVLLYQSYTHALTNREKASQYLDWSKPVISTLDNSYAAARPILSLFFLTLTTDNLVSIPHVSHDLLTSTVETQENAHALLNLILTKDKTDAQLNDVKTRISLLQNHLEHLKDATETLDGKLHLFQPHTNDIQEKLASSHELLRYAVQLISHADDLIGGADEKKYLVLFQNNMEIRPGGGFIGSFAVVTFANYTLKTIDVQDVYEADGQLKAHVEPPAALRKYLNQPHWFLRDSNFSADFPTNFNQAEFFLEKEIGTDPFHGGVALTTTAVSNILRAFGSVYLSDYKESVNSDNFYIKAQTHSEKDFFPGSKQKRNFLSSLTSVLSQQLQVVPLQDLMREMKRSLDEKQIVVYVKDEKIQSVVEALGWSGSILLPSCTEKSVPCVSDVLYPIDANLGVNKANFFLKRLMNLKTSLQSDGSIDHTLSITFTNESHSEVFPGGTYKNYFQLLLPERAHSISVLFDGQDQSDFDMSRDGTLSVFGYYLEVPPRTSRTLQVRYTLHETIPEGRSTYQLVVQKQIGSSNSDLVLELYLPDNISVTGNNFPALAKDRGLIYNTSLSSDRIFLINLSRH